MPELLDSYWPLVEPMFNLVNIDNPTSFARSIELVPRASLLLFAAHFCLSEVWNGGLMQFFFNSTGLLAPEAIEGFRAIEMPQLAEVIESAAACLGLEYPREREKRWDAMLAGSGLEPEKLAEIFGKAESWYMGLREATLGFGWDRMTNEIYLLAAQESGGFQTAATEFANHARTE